MSSEYIHGYDHREQERLLAQARIMESLVFDEVDFSQQKHILEIGCGVGAQTAVLLERFPGLKVTGVDVSEAQIQKAKIHHLDGDRVNFFLANAEKLPFEDGRFDGAFFCWCLEHVQDPLAILKEVRRCLKPGSVVHLDEVFNQLFYVSPRSEAIEYYWRQFNELQIQYGGHPYIGADLPRLLEQAGFDDVQVTFAPYLFDGRDEKARQTIVDYWHGIMLSASKPLLEKKLITPELIHMVEKDFAAVKSAKDGLIFIGFAKAKAHAGPIKSKYS